ncbi:hypothetical protein [Pleomorphomonas sp. JP5]|uniref:hypothetical protein n=1 Tax=Pleomorphomonas sp. JP5 TaxID=2942998 RepID=UPI002042FB78|nr:hypothetical protein [Pleomorphomonas sp. JP5]MCM5559386.1 hypothetical protein [Pleomorphomonas sp. JP5]
MMSVSLVDPNADHSVAVMGMDTFERRMRSFYRLVGLFIVIMGGVSSVLDFNFVFLITYIFFGMATFYFSKKVKDMAMLHLILHPSTLYLFTTMIFALGNGNVSLMGLVNKTSSSAVIFIYQTAIILAYVIYCGVVSWRGRSYITKLGRKFRFTKTVIFSIVIIVLYSIAESEKIVGITSAKYAILAVYLTLCVALYERAKGGNKKILIFIISITCTLLIAALVNRRSGVFVAILVWIILYVYSARRLITLNAIGLVFLGSFVLNVATNSFIQVRTDYQMGRLTSFGLSTLEAALDPQNVLYSIPFLSSTERVFSFSERSNKNYSELLASNGTEQDLSIGSRLSLFARMDIVTGRLGTGVVPDWSRLGLMTLSALPDYGQDKQLLVSDQIIWGLGLLPKEVIGRPLVTVAGELYAVGGFLGMFTVTLISFFLIFVIFHIIRLQIGYCIEYIICCVAATYNIAFTGTSVDMFLLILRNSIIIIFLIYLFKGLFKPERVPGNA